MGCIQTKKHAQITEDGEKIYSWDTKRKLNPADYTIQNQNDVTIDKLPGTVNGEQFIIQNCQNCNIYILDWINTITVDDCTDCNIFLGPTKGSIFIRDCKGCKMIAACQQFRARDCKKVDLFLCCATLPSIESCKGVRFGCFSYSYPELEAQFKSAGLSIFNNSWSEIHDFTPSMEGERNWELVRDLGIDNFVPNGSIPASSEPSLSLVPITNGSRNCSQSCLVVLFDDGQSNQRAKSFIKQLETTKNVLVRTKEVLMENPARVFGTDNYDSVSAKGPVIGLEFNGQESMEACTNTAVAINNGLVYISDDVKQVDVFFNYANMHLSM